MPVGTSAFDRTNPTTADDATTIPLAADNITSVLNGALGADTYGNNGATQELRLADATNFPSAGFITVGDEIISYSGKSSNTLTGIVRAAQSTAARAHVTRALVAYNFLAVHYNLLRAQVIALQQLFVQFKTERGTTDGTGTLALGAVPISGKKVLLFVNGVLYDQETDFTLSGSTITWVAVTPPAGMRYIAVYWAQ